MAHNGKITTTILYHSFFNIQLSPTPYLPLPSSVKQLLHGPEVAWRPLRVHSMMQNVKMTVHYCLQLSLLLHDPEAVVTSSCPVSVAKCRDIRPSASAVFTSAPPFAGKLDLEGLTLGSFCTFFVLLLKHVGCRLEELRDRKRFRCRWGTFPTHQLSL